MHIKVVNTISKTVSNYEIFWYRLILVYFELPIYSIYIYIYIERERERGMACVQCIRPDTMATHGQNCVTIVFGPMHWSTELKLNPICKLNHGNKFETWDIIALQIHTTKLWDTNLELFRIEG